jgi:three-Cys-motif partner protein
MPAPRSITWPLEPHTAVKHVILRKYLDAWLPILTSQHGRVVVLDGFAGPGEYAGGEPGSPLIAVDAFLSHSLAQLRARDVVFYFIERDPQRCERLKEVLATRAVPATAQIQVECGAFNESFSAVLDQLDERHLQLAPTFAFLDPFGYSMTPMSTIARLMRHERCEALITFMYEELNRFLSYNNAAHQARVGTLFATQDWRRVASLTGAPEERERHLHDLYQRQLRTAGGARYVRSFRMRNSSSRTDYFLFFVTNSLKGLDKMKQVMWKADPSGAFDFSDATDPQQPFLFSPTPDYEALKRMLRQRFSGESPTVGEIEDYVIADTPFTGLHYKRQALKPLEQAQLIGPFSSSPGRPAGTYADRFMRLHFKPELAQ